MLHGDFFLQSCCVTTRSGVTQCSSAVVTSQKRNCRGIVPQDSILSVLAVIKRSYNGCFITFYQQRFKINVFGFLKMFI